MSRRTIPLVLAATLLATLAAASIEGRWLHVRVEGGDEDEQISINVPLTMVRTLLEATHDDDLQDGKIRLEDRDWEAGDLQAMLAALRDAPDSEFVSVRSREETVRVAKESGYLVILAEDRGDGSARIRLPMRMVDAMLSGAPGELDLLAGLAALGEETGDLVVVEDGGERIRIWVDLDEAGR